MEKIKTFLNEHLWAKIIVQFIAFPFWLIYQIIKFIMNFSKIIINTLLILLLVSAIAGGFIYAKVLPMYEEATEQAYDKLTNLSSDNFHMLSNTVIYDKNGKKIGETNSGSYKYVKIKNISKYIQKGYIATEDKHFMEHAGIDLQSLLRAGISLVNNNGEITQGGSTITQQVIKNNLLTQEQSFSRKMTEVLLAPQLEKKFNKADIMEFYCNSNYYGNQCYGVETACKFYFGCSAKDVTLAQAAMLCGISNSPNKYNPIASMQFATEKKMQVLDNMLKEGYITDKQYNSAKKEKIKVVGIGQSTGSENYMVSYAIDCAILQLMRDDGFEFKHVFADANEQIAYKKKYSEVYSVKSALIRGGGYRIYTSLDPSIQKKLQDSVASTLSGFTEKSKKTKKYLMQSAAMCIDNDTQFVVAVVGGRTKKDEYNRAFLSTRQPGSTIKPILDYGPAIDNGVINASSIINDQKVYWDDNNKKSYSPNNAGGGFHGRVTAREGLARSLNTVAFQIFKNTGSEIAMRYLDRLQFSSLSYADNSAPAISLGGFTNGVTVNNMCRAYATLENDGQFSSRTCLTKIDHETQGTVYEAPAKEESETEVYSADTSYIMKDMMQGTFNESYGTGHSAYNDGQIYAGKTGTTSSSKDAWFCGFSAYYTTAVWIGYDTPRAMAGMYGNTYPLKIWSTFMNSVHTKLEKRDFDIPETLRLKRVSNGSFTGDKREINYSEGKRNYSQRPSGYDYYSAQNHKNRSSWEKDYKLDQTKQDAEVAVLSWEKYKINNVQKALSFKKKYDEVVSIIEKIPDEYEQKTYKERAAAKYDSLNDKVLSKWQDAIKEYQENQRNQAAAQSKIAAEDSARKAEAELKKNRINKLKWYTDQLIKRTYMTNTTKLLIQDGGKALKKVEGYEEYDSMKQRWEAAVRHAEGLPEKTNQGAPASGSDNQNIDKDKYKDPANPAPDPTQAPAAPAVPQAPAPAPAQ